MARYAEFSAQNMAEIISWTKSFLQTGGWTLSDESNNTTYNRAVWTATKNGAGHRFCAVYNGKFPFAITKGGSYGGSWEADSASGEKGWYTAAFGLRNMIYDAGDYFMIAPGIVFPCRILFFEMSDQSLLLSFEVETGRWQHIYSGALNKSLTGEWSGGMLMTGSNSPTTGFFPKYDVGFMRCNMPDDMIQTSHAAVTSIALLNGKLYWRRYAAAGYYFPTMFPVGSFEDKSSSSTLLYSLLEDVTSSDGYKNGSLINSIGQTQLVGLPSLYPFTYYIDGIYGAYLSDMWICPMQTCQPGEELWMGVQKYITLPQCSYDPTSLGFAVRVN